MQTGDGLSSSVDLVIDPTQPAKQKFFSSFDIGAINTESTSFPFDAWVQTTAPSTKQGEHITTGRMNITVSSVCLAGDTDHKWKTCNWLKMKQVETAAATRLTDQEIVYGALGDEVMIKCIRYKGLIRTNRLQICLMSLYPLLDIALLSASRTFLLVR